jgi:hypothetical protein
MHWDLFWTTEFDIARFTCMCIVYLPVQALDRVRNGDLLGHYIGCKKPPKKIKKNVNLMNI